MRFGAKLGKNGSLSRSLFVGIVARVACWVTMAATLAEFEQLIKQLMSEKGEVRVPAEKVYNDLKQSNPDALVIALLQLIKTPTDDAVRIWSLKFHVTVF